MRCRNLEHRATRIKVGARWVTMDHCGGETCNHAERCPCRCAGCLGAERRGCQNEAGSMPRLSLPLSRAVLPSNLCDACRAEYAARRPLQREHVAHLGAVDPMPGLCDHGQRAGVCGVCT